MWRELRPDLQRRRDAALLHCDDFVGLTAADAERLAAPLEINLELVRPGQVVRMNLVSTRLRAHLNDDGVVASASVG